MFSAQEEDVPEVSKRDVHTSTGKMLHVRKFAIDLLIVEMY